ncbi:hypothetical protein SLEP1_g7166 [Rubroshorea leprosula]|uniref:beta-galactosidase n=1 Tax=Rubroshorea leprosula TaxID=152421 RepID=A0AAV5I6J8_9ROSI|nr:hypothetical protein SLEP1_g7166 [Rubroshorea leprosula]
MRAANFPIPSLPRLVLLVLLATTSFGANVTYDHRAIVIDGKRRVLISGSIHYPRSTPEMWPDLIQKSKDGGLDVIQTYVFWNLHEPVRNQYNFEGRNDLVKFVKLVGEAGLYVHLRIGPYWSAGMAISLDTGVPWVMCQQSDAPDPIINTCNGFYCDQFTPNSNTKPKMWTENWSGWFLPFGGSVPYRPVEDLAFAVARFYQRGGTFQNYYMYHGGTNFGRTSGGPFIATSYDYDAPIDEYGIPRQPKWGHLKDVHKAIKLCEEALVATDPTYTSPGPNLEATVYNTGSGICAAFLANVGTSDVTVNFNSNSYRLPAWSVSILPDCKNVVLNTAKINSMTMIPSFMHQALNVDTDSTEAIGSDWSWINEPVGISKDDAFTKSGLSEQINTTADQSDYLWYSLSIDIKGEEPFLEDGFETILHVESLGHALRAFINGKLAGSANGNSDNAKVAVEIPITLVPGKNTIDLLSMTVGLQNYGAFFDKWGAGITGPVELKSSKNGNSIDLSSQQWTYQIGLKGEDLGLPTGSSSQWVSQPDLPKNQPLIWYKKLFDAPAGNDPVSLDFTGMGKGEAWINGQSIGRYWPTYISPNSGCTDPCDYRGTYKSEKCRKNCGKPSQVLYHVPRSWLQSSGNSLVLLEEIGGDPTQIAFGTRQMGSLCSHVSESHPLPVDMWNSASKTETKPGPTLSLTCPYTNQVISSIKFASFGTPSGSCGSFSHGQCSSARALSILQKACIGSRNCSIPVSASTFGDPCGGVTKSLAVEASCT